MRSVSFCLVKGQETQLSLEQEVKIAEHSLLLSTLKPRIASLPGSWRTVSVETPEHGQVVTLFQRDEEKCERLKGRMFYSGYIHTVQLPSPFSQIPAA